MARHLLAVPAILACATACATTGAQRRPPDAVARADAPPSDPDASIMVAPG